MDIESVRKLFISTITSASSLIEHTIEDFSDADLLTRPCEGANHPLWQIGHLTTAQAHMVNACDQAHPVQLPKGFADRFTPEAATSNSNRDFPARAELMDTFRNVQQSTVAWIQQLGENDLAAASPERIRPFCPTVGNMPGMLAGHMLMHLGQIQVCRRKLGKPILM